eukprot:CAMPEP_0198320022 /NCGR_PEP_ID=MMETSP1450-20131203/9037_1 /TAXON_ID=753684 ORGANISM="Madagascaria erythrocladiodes, Strain CCMP3234" /NCGR_SAMPLE_ID=MMETSP1450 /ASSEMBLY_ACC=CAM_ASM_001115 /LENGTH=550 /DNA_ID=CAMNT_0044023455 /DNA_START=117 /DNA_END=1769 /DNA_ORIENTATION=+
MTVRIGVLSVKCVVSVLVALLMAVPSVGADFVDGSEGPGTGLVGEINLFDRLADAIGTVLQLIGQGNIPTGFVIHSERTGPMPSAFRDAYFKSNLPKCAGGIDDRCNAAADGLGTIGRVGYRFESSLANLRGSSMQTQIACLCVNVDCSLSVVIHPVVIEENNGSKSTECLLAYNEEAEKLITCPIELLRISPNTEDTVPDPAQDKRAWNFSVITEQDWWVATGFRSQLAQWTREQFDDVPFFERDIYGFNSEEVEANFLLQVPTSQPKVSLFRGVTPALSGQGNPCDLPLRVAANGAAWIATQQDRHATGREEETYLEAKPQLVSDTELALVGSAAALGTLAGFSILHRAETSLLDANIFSPHFERRKALVSYAMTVLVALLAFVLEALPLQVALGQEIGASRWMSEMLALDVALGVNGDKSPSNIRLGENGVASNGSVAVASALIGKVSYHSTRASLVGGLTAAFDILFVLRLLWHSVKQIRLLRAVWKHRAAMEEAETLSKGSQNDDSDEGLTPPPPPATGRDFEYLTSSSGGNVLAQVSRRSSQKR